MGHTNEAIDAQFGRYWKLKRENNEEIHTTNTDTKNASNNEAPELELITKSVTK